MGEYTAFGDSIKKSGQYIGANQLQPTTPPPSCAHAMGKSPPPTDPTRDEGAARRLLTSSKQRSERRNQGGVADSVGEVWVDRGAPHR